MHVTLLVIAGCPGAELADERLRAAVTRLGRDDVTVERRVVTTEEEAEAVHFHGSPTVLVDGQDPFLDRDRPVGLSCRVYRTDGGLAGAPTVAQLVAALR